jgi:tetratricopeptide (TPR) repeat protein/tRNA A-37 threonylcarbamoyl transferase component Bud32
MATASNSWTDEMEAPNADWQRVDDLFDRALELPPEARASWLQETPMSESERDGLAAMLRAHAREGVLDRPIIASYLPNVPADPLGALQSALAGRYRIERVIGEGGMATVYLAQEIKHDRAVVLKVLKPEVAAWLGGQRFRAEIQILARLSHPYIVPLIDSGEAAGMLYYVMPYMGGETLRDRLTKGRLALRDALGVLGDLAAALAHAHATGLVHRDLKPANVLWVAGHAYLMDFGIAKPQQDFGSSTDTIEGFAIGTPAYMAPEHLAGKRVDARSDVYAWGVLARETIPGKTPRALRDLIDKCVSQDPAERPEDGAALVARLERARARTIRTRRLTFSSVVGIGVLASLAGAWFVRQPTIDLEAVPGPIVVSVLQNETGDSSLSMWGRLAGDWLTQGLQETGRASIVPWPVALDAAKVDSQPRTSVEQLAAETGAQAVVAGSYYLLGDRVRFQAQLIDARGTPMASIQPVDAHRDSIDVAVRDLRDRLMGMVAMRHGEEGTIASHSPNPPRYATYLEFERGLQMYNRQQYREAVEVLLNAWRGDTTFTPAAVLAARSMWNISARDRADSVVRSIRARRTPLSQYLELEIQYIEAMLASDAPRALVAIRQAAARSPGGRANYNLAFTALSVGRASEAVDALKAVNPDRGALRTWAPYWYVLTHAQHLLGRYADEIAANREMRKRFPESRAAWIHEVRAFAALGDTPAIDSVYREASALPPDTYWSQGAMLVMAAEELEAHGFPDKAPAYYQRAATWLADQLARNPMHEAHRYWLGSSYYDQQRWSDALPYFRSLHEGAPDDLQYRGLLAVTLARLGQHAAADSLIGAPPRYGRGGYYSYRARLAAIRGDPGAALSLWSEAIGGGVNGIVWLHASARHDLSPVASDSTFRRLGIVPVR